MSAKILLQSYESLPVGPNTSGVLERACKIALNQSLAMG